MKGFLMIEIANEAELFERFKTAYRVAAVELSSMINEEMPDLSDEELMVMFTKANEESKNQYVYWLTECLRREFHENVKYMQLSEYNNLFNYLRNKLIGV
jgi:uncharacterized protein (DUF2336 family)